MAEKTKQITRRDILISFHDQWLGKKLAAELDLEYHNSSSILINNISKDLEQRREQNKKLETLIEVADKYLVIINEKLKEDV